MADETKPAAADAPRVSSRDYRPLLEASAAYRKYAAGVTVTMRGQTIMAPELYGRDAVRLGRVMADVLSGHGYTVVGDMQFHPLYFVVKEA
jgi:hypothetical protein